jgi:hypothetical protein
MSARSRLEALEKKGGAGPCNNPGVVIRSRLEGEPEPVQTDDDKICWRCGEPHAIFTVINVSEARIPLPRPSQQGVTSAPCD